MFVPCRQTNKSKKKVSLKTNYRLMKTINVFLGTALLSILPLTANAQFMMFGSGNRASQDSLRKIAAADYADMLTKLNIQPPREGRQPNNADESKHPNYDELTANPYPFYPDALTLQNGKKVKNAKEWTKKRRPELVKLFEDNVYGRIPDNTPSVTWEVTSEEKKDFAGMPVVVRNLKGIVDNSSYPSITVEIQANVVYPDNGSTKLPVIIEFGFGGGDPTRTRAGQQSWQQMVVERGWAAATINPSSIQADAGSGLTNIINGHIPVKEAKGESPIKADGRLLVIDGGFSKVYHQQTGIAGYTLIYNSHGMRLVRHHPFESIHQSVAQGMDVIAATQVVEYTDRQILVRDTDKGKRIMARVNDLRELLQAYRSGLLRP